MYVHIYALRYFHKVTLLELPLRGIIIYTVTAAASSLLSFDSVEFSGGCRGCDLRPLYLL